MIDLLKQSAAMPDCVGISPTFIGRDEGGGWQGGGITLAVETSALCKAQWQAALRGRCAKSRLGYHCADENTRIESNVTITTARRVTVYVWELT